MSKFDANAMMAAAESQTSTELTELRAEIHVLAGTAIQIVGDIVTAIDSSKKATEREKLSEARKAKERLIRLIAGLENGSNARPERQPRQQRQQAEPVTTPVTTPEPAATPPADNETTKVAPEPVTPVVTTLEPAAESTSESTGEKLVREAAATLKTTVDEVKKSHEAPKTDDKPAEKTEMTTVEVTSGKTKDVENTSEKAPKSRGKRFLDALKK